MGNLFEQLTLDINHQASVNIAKLAKEVGVERYIFSSSCSMYGIAGDSALDESATQNPVTAYAKSKVYTERDLLPLLTDDFSVTFLRNATAYGVSPMLRTDLVVNDFVGAAFTSGKIVIKSDGSPWRPLVHCEDIARAFVAVIEADKDRIHGEAFNVGRNEDNYRVREVAEIVGNVVPNCEVIITNEFGADTRNYRVNFDKITRQLPEFKPKWTVPTGVIELYEAFKEHGLTADEVQSRKYVRLKQLHYLMDTNRIDKQLFFV
jgi:nucleoside-diphosphate-sugar epimerase